MKTDPLMLGKSKSVWIQFLITLLWHNRKIIFAYKQHLNLTESIQDSNKMD